MGQKKVYICKVKLTYASARYFIRVASSSVGFDKKVYTGPKKLHYRYNGPLWDKK